ncbi:hypothetical protein XENOCAPTIV_028485 [Xenoophorus captivus]|uniref:Uncharacterized protein n=1 Tax=Xenoophorus captivus TaxID=1517983 RepID=A0ABV0R5B4_9TELE
MRRSHLQPRLRLPCPEPDPHHRPPLSVPKPRFSAAFNRSFSVLQWTLHMFMSSSTRVSRWTDICLLLQSLIEGFSGILQTIC